MPGFWHIDNQVFGKELWIGNGLSIGHSLSPSPALVFKSITHSFSKLATFVNFLCDITDEFLLFY